MVKYTFVCKQNTKQIFWTNLIMFHIVNVVYDFVYSSVLQYGVCWSSMRRLWYGFISDVSGGMRF